MATTDITGVFPALILKVIVSIYRGKTNEQLCESYRSRMPYDVEKHKNLINFKRDLEQFLGLKKQAQGLGIPNIDIKLYRLARTSCGKTENYLICTQEQWNVELPLLLGDENSDLNVHVIQRVVSWSDKSVVIVSVPDTLNPSGTNSCTNKSSTNNAKKNVEQESCTQKSSRVRKRKIEANEDKNLQHDLMCDLNVVRNDRQTEELARLQDELKKLSNSKALNEMKFVSGICHKKYNISGSRTIEGKISYYKTTHFDKCMNKKEKLAQDAKRARTLD
ncbi:Hypothetical predicted protein, partial [Paramuricea clavata]